MVDESASITTSVSQSVSVQQSVTEGVSAKTGVSRNVSIGEVIDAVASPYADIVATSPSLFVPLKYASTDADGQILYQDSAATTPVTTEGDPVGAVVWDSVTVMQQSTDSLRPVWQGDSRGVNFDPAGDQFLEGMLDTWFAGDAPMTVIAKSNPSSYGVGSNDRCLWSAGVGASTEMVALALETASDTTFRLNGGNAIYDALPLTSHVSTSRYQGGGVVWELWEDGVAKSLTSSSTTTMSFTDRDFRIGEFPPAYIGSEFDGDVEAVAVYDTALSDPDRSTSETAFLAL